MNDWKEYELGELLDYEQPTSFFVESTNYDDKYDIPVLTAGKSFILGYTNEQTGVYNKLPVIIFDDFTTASRYVNFPFKVKSSAMKILTANTDMVLPKFIYYRMQIIQFDHSTHKRYWIQQYSKIKVAIPSLEEQQRIVARIEELYSQLDDAEATLQKTKAQLALYRQAVISSAYPNIPQEKWVRLDSIAEIIGGITKGRDLTGQKTVELPYLRVANVQNGFLDLSVMKTIELKESEKEHYLLKEGDVLYTEGGDRDKLGRGTVWHGEIPECVHQNHVFKARLQQERALPDYVAYWSMSTYARNYFYEKGKQSVNLASINKTVLSALTLPLPPISLQQSTIEEIDMRLSVCNNIESMVNDMTLKTEALRQAILMSEYRGNHNA